MKIGIVGMGNMGSAFYKGMIKTFDEKDIYLCDRDVSKLFEFKKSKSTTHTEKLIPKCDIVILAIKPQSFEKLVKSLDGYLKNKLIISIMAGISIVHLKQKTKSQKIVRAMPNLAVQIEKGLIGWTSTPKVTAKEKQIVKIILESLGEAVHFKTETKIDALTAISGSGPGYFFYLADLLAKKAQKVGFTKKQAINIAEATLSGTGCLVGHNKNLTLKEWLEAVMSKGGTTEAAIKYLKKSNFPKLFEAALEEAIIRSKELNQ